MAVLSLWRAWSQCCDLGNARFIVLAVVPVEASLDEPVVVEWPWRLLFIESGDQSQRQRYCV